MTRIVLEKEAAKLAEIKDSATICDASGRVLGYFTPATDHALYEDLVIPFTEEELQRLDQEEGKYSTAEVLEYLRRLESEPS